MEISELIAKKQELADKIAGLIKSFEKDNDVTVGDVSIWFSNYNREKEDRINITIALRIV